MLLDSTITSTQVGILAALSKDPKANSTSLNLDNLSISGVDVLIKDGATGASVLAGGTTTIASWGWRKVVQAHVGQGNFQAGGPISVLPTKSANLLGSKGFFERSKPQYETYSAAQFVSVKSSGAKGDGQSDDTAALNAAFQSSASSGNVAYLPQGVYIVTNTVFVPSGARVVGEAWSQIMAFGPKFQDQSNP